MPFVDHMSVGVSDLRASARFYDAVLAPLGEQRRFQEGNFVGYGGGAADGGFSICRPASGIATPQPGAHVCFAAGSREEVRGFHAAALANGGADNGPPGYRPEYDADYFGAFVIDPDGNHLGAVARVHPGTPSTPRARIIDHLSIGVADIAAAAWYYDAVFARLDVQRLFSAPDFIMYGTELASTTFILGRTHETADTISPQEGFHACFSAKSREEVAAFHAVAVNAGGTDNGRPGYRPDYGRDYYGAFVIDPAGNHLGIVARVSPERV